MNLDFIKRHLRNLFSGSDRHKNLINTKMIDLVAASQIKAQYWKEQAENSTKELELVKQLFIQKNNKLEKENEQKTDTFIQLAHDLKMPLLLVSNYLSEYIKANEETEELIIIRENLEKIKKDIVNIFDIEKLQKEFFLYNEKQTIDLSQLIFDTISLFNHYATTKKIKLTHSIEKDIFINVDPNAICRIVNNLIENAIKFTDEYGSIHIRLEVTRFKIIFVVKDTGIGIPNEFQDRIFEPYFQPVKKNNSGIGLGLAIVKKITENLDGTIKLVSKVESGTEISIVLPKYQLLENESVTTFAIKESPSLILEKLDVEEEILDDERPTVLLITEKVSFINFLVKKLKKKYNIAYSLSGEEGLERISTLKHLDLILADVSLKSDTGLEFYKNISENKKYNHFPLFILTSQATIEEKIQGLSYGAVNWIEKPFYVEELISKIDAFLKTLENQRIKLINSAYQQISKGIEDPIEILFPTDSPIFEEKCKLYNLTKQEIEVFKRFVDGQPYKKIAENLFISTGTVGTHINKIYRKLEVNNRTMAIAKLFSQKENHGNSKNL